MDYSTRIFVKQVEGLTLFIFVKLNLKVAFALSLAMTIFVCYNIALYAIGANIL